ncbi:MAG: tetratricopeptide repeat-containing protein [Verrucomicrobiales bacterium]|nr:tetratricopeptide repeat-containing protein [Verrucomicrobiales bacterium]
MKAFWITFYSYKGGVGRSLSLANAAALLVKRGRRVVLIDFDLEAPGLDSFQEFKSVIGKQGVVEYVAEFETTKRAPDITEFVHPCELDGVQRGKLWIMPAGKKDSFYNSCRANLDWVRLYESGLGQPFVENWKAAITRHYEPDYVLVDSRTGLTDVGGICTLHLPDLVVMVFGLNEQNVRGIAAVAKTIRESEGTRLPQIHYVASPVPNLPRDEKSPMMQRLTSAASQLGVKIESIIRYNPLAALSERLFVLEEESKYSPLVEDYQELLQRLITYNRTGLDFLWAQARQAISNVDTALMERLVTVFEQEFPERPEALLARAKLKKALGDLDSSTVLARRAYDADPNYDLALDWLISAARRDKDYKTALQLSLLAVKNAERFSAERKYELNQDLGTIAMTARDYETARAAFKNCLGHIAEKKAKGDHDPSSSMIHLFNQVEASRRAGKQISTKIWQAITNLFESTGETSEAPLVFQANRWQAIHIAYAMAGHKHRAKEALAKARHAAELLGLAEDIFSVEEYLELPVHKFLKTNHKMLAAVEQGKLWDGMALPSGEAKADSGDDLDESGIVAKEP